MPKDQEGTAWDLLRERLRHHRGYDWASYALLLETPGPEAELEWAALALGLTIGESYFFRDAGQFKLLERTILPDRIRIRSGQRRLKIWSAGCSTGEEPYSLAMLLDRLLPQDTGWRVNILGTDINEEFLAKARQGEYGSWSFRSTPEYIRTASFNRMMDKWRIHERLRERVRFEKLNLIRDAFPDPARGIEDLDLIICRNVFIYFDPPTVSRVVSRMARCLAPGGYLVTGHAEIMHRETTLLEPLRFAESVIYQRLASKTPLAARAETAPEPTPPARGGSGNGRETSVPARRRKPANEGRSIEARSVNGSRPSPRARDAASPARAEPLAELRELFFKGRYQEVIERARSLALKGRPLAEALLLAGRSLANQGRLEDAEQACLQALEQHEFYPAPYWLLAQIALERDGREQAKEFLSRALYLDGTFIAAYLDLARLYADEGDAERASTMRSAAASLLAGLPEEARVDQYEEWRPAELLLSLNQSGNAPRS